MTTLRSAARLTAASALAGALLAACATPSPQPAETQPAAPGRAWGEMAPIPNPPEDESSSPAASPAPRRAAEPQARSAPPPPRESSPAPAQKPGGGAQAAQAAQAAKLRTQGLTELNRGNVESAVRLLRQAQALDPDNALIARDLERALRISRAVRSAP
ncbi:MAG: hypothetical protein H2041_06370 [Phenylobacterium sp.]|uniref:hypothetical protein n=1 Tax=Phenylobacterium sp. TaxID=1871053 RepID=UPI0017F37523|nr:hypothetical protein [Phenylobacterium sp.]MBA4793275.1 hypothetical protein [Phenylobacterium sp.]